MRCTYQRYSEEGTFTVWALVLCLILFALAGISVDVWRAFDARRQLTDIADTASRAGASEINVYQRQIFGTTVLDPIQAQHYAEKSIQDNAALQSISITNSTIEVDPATNEVTVEIHSTFSFFLLRLLPEAGDADVGARATAQPFEG